MSLYEKDGTKIWENVDRFNELIALKAKENFIKEHIVKRGKESLMLLIHEKRFNDIAKRYTGKDTNESHKDK